MSCYKTIKDQGLKLTPQRRIIIDAIHEEGHELTTEYILSRVKEQMPEVHKSTVYRNLETLEKAGCLFKSEVDNKIVYHHAEHSGHFHLVCEKCGKTIACDEELFAPVVEALSKTKKFMLDTQSIVLKGICSDCLKS